MREEPMPDGGVPDAGSPDMGADDLGVGDAGDGDAGTGDAGALPIPSRDGGCGCRIADAQSDARDSSIGFFAVLALLGAIRLTRRRR
jgi:MYXO-CTERM domain-containing protein